ncbi:MAG: molybdopterin-dependent oxidoreductase [Pirellulaceae bacterium]
MASSPDRLPPGQHLAAEGKWPLVGERRPRPGDAPWTVAVAGLIAPLRIYTLDQLAALPQTEMAVDIHCVTRWSKLDVPVRGVLLADLLADASTTEASLDESARYVSFVANSERNHSTSLPLADALQLGALVALETYSEPLPEQRGGPVRMIVPGRYFYKSVKWLARIELLRDDRLGYWEAEAGYHNTADPWREQRYVASNLGKGQAAALIAARDFSGRDLLGIDAADRELVGLDARRALLRNADFRRADLREARFDGANLSNAHFELADLRRAIFLDADLEGADFTSADLRGADLRAASLFGATFYDPHRAERAVQIDQTTRLDPARLDDLVPFQSERLRGALGLS